MTQGTVEGQAGQDEEASASEVLEDMAISPSSRGISAETGKSGTWKLVMGGTGDCTVGEDTGETNTDNTEVDRTVETGTDNGTGVDIVETGADVTGANGDDNGTAVDTEVETTVETGADGGTEDGAHMDKDILDGQF